MDLKSNGQAQGFKIIYLGACGSLGPIVHDPYSNTPEHWEWILSLMTLFIRNVLEWSRGCRWLIAAFFLVLTLVIYDAGCSDYRISTGSGYLTISWRWHNIWSCSQSSHLCQGITGHRSHVTHWANALIHFNILSSMRRNLEILPAECKAICTNHTFSKQWMPFLYIIKKINFISK